MNTCNDCRKHLPDLLLDPTYAAMNSKLADHLDDCAECRAELAELRSTFALLDEFTAPEVSLYFDTRLHARLREEVAAQPEGFWERTRSWLLFSTGRQFRPAVAGALSLVILVGGAGFIPFHGTTTTSATVNDLKVFDNNAQAIQQLDQLLDDGNDDPNTPPTS